MTKFQRYFSLSALVLLMVAFQNCQMSDQFGSSFESRSSKTLGSSGTGGLNGNGGGYTGKINIAAPTQISQGQPYVVVIEGGAPPYQISSPEGNIQVVNVSGNVYELRNQFNQPVTRFDLDVRDSLNNTATATIEIVASDNVFNYSFARAALFANNHTYIFDHNLRMVLVFDENGFPAATLNPSGDRERYFETFIDMAKDSRGNVFILEPEHAKISYFNPDHSFEREVDLKSFIPGIVAASFTVHNDQIFVVDQVNNQVLPIHPEGYPETPLTLNGATFHTIAGVAFDDNSGRVYVSDEVRNEIMIFEGGNLSHSITQVLLGSSTVDLVGPTNMDVDAQGNIYVIDRIWKEGPYAGRNSGYLGRETTYKLSHSSGSSATGTRVYSRETSYWHSTSDCLSVEPGRISYCNHSRYLTVVDDQGGEVAFFNPHHNALRTVNEPQNVVVDEEGNYFVTSDYNYLVGISSDQQIMWRKLGWGTDNYSVMNIGGTAVIGDWIYVSSSKTKEVKVYSKLDFQFQFKFQVRDSQGTTRAPQKLKAFGDRLFIQIGYDQYAIHSKDGNAIRTVHRLKSKSGNSFDLQNFRDWDFDDQGNLYVLSFNQKTTYKIDVANDQIVEVMNKNKNSLVMAVDSARRLIFYQEWNSIRYYNMDTGGFVGSFGIGGIIPGTFNEISSLDIHGRYIYATDYYNQRVQKISLSLFDNIDQ